MGFSKGNNLENTANVVIQHTEKIIEVPIYKDVVVERPLFNDVLVNVISSTPFLSRT